MANNERTYICDLLEFWALASLSPRGKTYGGGPDQWSKIIADEPILSYGLGWAQTSPDNSRGSHMIPDDSRRSQLSERRWPHPKWSQVVPSLPNVWCGVARWVCFLSRMLLSSSIVLMLWEGGLEWGRLNVSFDNMVLAPPHPDDRFLNCILGIEWAPPTNHLRNTVSNLYHLPGCL